MTLHLVPMRLLTPQISQHSFQAAQTRLGSFARQHPRARGAITGGPVHHPHSPHCLSPAPRTDLLLPTTSAQQAAEGHSMMEKGLTTDLKAELQLSSVGKPIDVDSSQQPYVLSENL